MRKSTLATCVFAGLFASTVQAEVTLNGFASIKAGSTLGGDDALYGYTKDIDFKNESLFALQAQADLGDKLSVTAQLMAKGVNDFDAEFAWAFVSYQLNDETRINAGRVRVPFYKYSDFLDVGYAYDWLRTPRSVYDVPFDTMDGVSLYHSSSWGDWQSSFQVVYGSYEGDVTISGVMSPMEVQDLMGGTWELSNDWFSARVAYMQADVTINSSALDPLLAGLNQFGFASVASEIDFNEDKGSFFGIGFGIDKNDWVINTEFTIVKIDNSFLAKRDSYFVSVGHRFDKITPFVSYEKNRDNAHPDIYAPIPMQHPLYAPTAGLVMSQESNWNVYNVGLRYDFHPSAAFKVLLTQVDDQLSSNKTELLAVGVDLVF